MHKLFASEFIALCAFLVFSNGQNLNAQENDWNASYTGEVVLTINESNSGATYIEKGSYTILNEDALKFCKLRFAYGFNSEIEKISASLKSPFGKVLKKLKKSDIVDVNAQRSGSLYVDTRIKAFTLTHTNYPFVLEYEVEIKYDRTFFYPSWTPRMAYELLNISSTYKLVVPKSKTINIYEHNIQKANTNNEGNSSVYEWKVDSISPIADEPFSYSEYWDAPKVLTAPSTFDFEYKGDNNSWIGYGNWIYKLNEGRDELSLQEKDRIDSLLIGAESDFQKVDNLYKYLQNNTRYVSIQKKIGGWQPFTAEFVCDNKYGDCKALANYMKAMLKYVGIESNYTLVRAGNNTSDIIVDFSSNQFNHAILMVPLHLDTVWLDCTSKVTPTGFVEKFIADRHVLLIEKDNSHLVKTPTYDTVQNCEYFTGTITLNSDLSGLGNINLERTAHRSSGSRRLNKLYNAHISEKYADHKLNLPSYTIQLNEHKEQVKGYLPSTIDSINFKVEIAGKKAGPELLLNYPLKISLSSSIEVDDRQTDIYIQESYTRKDSLFYLLPEAFRLSQPYSFEYDSEFGKVNYELSSVDNRICLQARYSINKGRYSKDKINNFKEYIEQINKIESYEIIVSKF